MAQHHRLGVACGPRLQATVNERHSINHTLGQQQQQQQQKQNINNRTEVTITKRTTKTKIMKTEPAELTVYISSAHCSGFWLSIISSTTWSSISLPSSMNCFHWLVDTPPKGRRRRERRGVGGTNALSLGAKSSIDIWSEL